MSTTWLTMMTACDVGRAEAAVPRREIYRPDSADAGSGFAGACPRIACHVAAPHVASFDEQRSPPARTRGAPRTRFLTPSSGASP